MCDSLVVEILIDDDITDEEYQQCKFPDKPLNEPVHASADFRFHMATTTVTGAGFKITPLGQLVPRDEKGRRFKHGQIAGYLVEFNPPACMIGHNRQLAVSVYQGVLAAMWSLKYWLAVNGCTKAGLDRIKSENINILSVTLTLLYPRKSEKNARCILGLFRAHTEGLLNTDGKVIAKSFPPEAPKDGTPYTYTSYVDIRSCELSVYVKELDQPNSFTLPIEVKEFELEIQQFAVSTLRLEIRTKPAWMKTKELNKLAAWKGASGVESIQLVFGLLRETLLLDENLRTTTLKKTTVPGLGLKAAQKKYLLYYLAGHNVREHADFRKMDSINASKAYSAVRLPVLNEIKIDFDISNEVRTKQLSEKLCELLVYPGEFTPKDHLAPYVFSRVSARVALEQLRDIVNGVLESGPGSVPPVPTLTVYRGPNPPVAVKRTAKQVSVNQASVNPRRSSGIGNAPLQKDEDFE